jgi:hypothetical protein
MEWATSIDSAGVVLLLWTAIACSDQSSVAREPDASVGGAAGGSGNAAGGSRNAAGGSGNTGGGGNAAGGKHEPPDAASPGEGGNAGTGERDSGPRPTSEGGVSSVAGVVAYYGVPFAGAKVVIQGRTSITDAKGRFVSAGVVPPYDATVVFEQYRSVLRVEGVTRKDARLDCTSCPVPTAMLHTVHVRGTVAPPDDRFFEDGAVASADTVYTSVDLDNATHPPAFIDKTVSVQPAGMPGSEYPLEWTSKQPLTSNTFSEDVTWVGPASTTGHVRVTLTRTGTGCTDYIIGSVEAPIAVMDGDVVDLNLHADPVPLKAVTTTVSGPSEFYPPHQEREADDSVVSLNVGLNSGPCLANGSHAPRYIGDRVYALGEATPGGPCCVTSDQSFVSYSIPDDPEPFAVDLTLRSVTQVRAEGSAYRLTPDVAGYHTVWLMVGEWDVELVTMNDLVRAPQDLPADAGTSFVLESVRTRTGSIDDVTSPTPVAHPDIEYDTMGYTYEGNHAVYPN